MPTTALAPPSDSRNPFWGVEAVAPIDPPVQAADDVNGNHYTNARGVFLVTENPTGSVRTITVPWKTRSSYGGEHPVVITVPANSPKQIVGQLPHPRFSSRDDLLVELQFDGPGLNVGLVRLT